jgi:hypothetical protein
MMVAGLGLPTHRAWPRRSGLPPQTAMSPPASLPALSGSVGLLWALPAAEFLCLHSSTMVTLHTGMGVVF